VCIKISLCPGFISGVEIGKYVHPYSLRGGGGDTGDVIWEENMKIGREKKRNCERKRRKRGKVKRKLMLKSKINAED
jgi:hypothetical protein